jgi:hypothetical protein
MAFDSRTFQRTVHKCTDPSKPDRSDDPINDSPSYCPDRIYEFLSTCTCVVLRGHTAGVLRVVVC